jgi:hypothetical protein
LETQPVNLQSPESSLEPEGRLVRVILEQAVGPVRQLGPSAGRSGRRRIQPGLDGNRRLRISPILPDSEMSDEGVEGASRAHVGDSLVASADLVSTPPGAGVRAGPNSAERSIAVGASGPAAPAVRIAPTGRLEIVRRQFESSGLSGRVVELLMGGWRDSTSAAYQSAWSNWSDWCVREETDPMSPSIAKVLDFLSSLVSDGKAYRTVNVHRSMLSSTLGKLDGFDLGKHPLVVKLMRGVYNKKPPSPKYSNFWEVDSVVEFLISLGPNGDLPFKNLSLKLAMLLALSSLCRVSELASIYRYSVVFCNNQAKFSLQKPRKFQRNSPLQVITLEKLLPLPLACPVETLKDFLIASDQLRQGEKAKSLFIGLRPPHSSVGASSVARWLKLILNDAGVDTSIYSAHSTRGASASNAVNSGVPTEAILAAGNWNSESTFTRFYRRAAKGASVANALRK